ncbi:MAG: hypothetical protein HOC74_27780 [Gemmatimonadetes bacterium]|nr:hypothetical protein [Gemmatimonadota bacterium]
MKIRPNLLFWLVFVFGLGCVESQAQIMRLYQQGSQSNRIAVGVGDQVNIEVFADLKGIESAGISFYISVPSDAFQVVDQEPTNVGVQPFVRGPLFSGATPGPNLLLPETDPAAEKFVGQQLEYSMVVGGGADRVRTGAGVVATFSLTCVKPIENGAITIDDNAVRETFLVLSDGINEKRFQTTMGMEISVSGIQLRDIPDVVLRPGTADSLTIGSLNSYLINTSVTVDSLRWSYVPADFDSLDIQIDPETKWVTITPAEGWVGRRQVTWTATEPIARVPGLPPLSASEVSTVIVNNPPQFTMVADSNGVKRDTIRFREDVHPFQGGNDINNPLRAFRWVDLDNIVVDPDIVDPQDELVFVGQTYGQYTLSDVRGQVESDTHELLVWSKAEFSGIDSLKIVVRDGLRGGEDSLRVIIEVEGENDPPKFTLESPNPKITRGGSKTYLLEEIIEDPDTPLEDLVFSWVDDPGGHFSVDTTHAEVGVQITVKGTADFAGDGRVTFRIEDPEDPVILVDQILLFFQARESLPPDIFPSDTKIDLSPGQPGVEENLDDFVNDPDNTPDQLAWLLPPKTYQSDIGIDADRNVDVSAPLKFIGYEEVILTVTDPDNQSDFLKLRIYSSDGDPVTGGIPDLILDRGETNREIDLDNYYHDSDNLDEEMFWEALRTYDQNNLQVQIDPVTHLVNFFVPENAAFKTETVVFRVTSPEGTSAADTMLVTIVTGGGGSEVGGFNIKPFPSDMQVPVERFTNVLDLDDYVVPPDETITWSVAVLAGENSIPRGIEGNVLSIFGLQSGVDTLQFTAQDTLGRVGTTTGIVRVFGESEVLNLLSIPDIQFIAGQTAISDTLHKFIEDREAHPDSVVQWSLETTGPQGSIFIQVKPDNTLFAVAPDTGTAEVVLIARDTALGVTGRDTIRVIALDPSLGNKSLKEFPPVIFVSGQEDSSITLNDYLPDEFTTAEGDAPPARWTVAGQQITQPIIATEAPHDLLLKGVGAQIGIDTLTFVADLGGGFRAVGLMAVTVVEPVDETTLDLQVVPNPTNPFYIDLFVTARRELAGSPNVIRSFDASDSTVSVRQIEDELVERGVLIWTGSVRLPLRASGTALFQAQAFTALGTDVKDTASVSYATSVAGKALAIEHRGAVLDLPPNALPAETAVLLQVASSSVAEGAAKAVGFGGEEELELLGTIDILPAGRQLAHVGGLSISEKTETQDGVYRFRGGRWIFLGRAGSKIIIEQLGRYGLLRDSRPPELQIAAEPGEKGDELLVRIEDGGSGIDQEGVDLLLDGLEVDSSFEAEWLQWQPPFDLKNGRHHLEVRARDRSGNQVTRELYFSLNRSALPLSTELGRNFPNPFNPETAIPFALSPNPASQTGEIEVQLVIFNISGQLVRQLLDESMSPGQHEVLWDGRDATGAKVGSGIYIYRLQTRHAVQARRMTLLK